MALWRNSYFKIAAKTASYQILQSEHQTLFTNRGATASITFTLPPTNTLAPGFEVIIYGISATGFVVASFGSSDNIVALNDAGADSITVTTTSLIIGGSVRLIWDGTSWLSIRGAGNTYAVA